MKKIQGMDLKEEERAFSLSGIRQRLNGAESSSYYVIIGALVLTVLIFMALTNSLASKREQRIERKKAELGEFYRLANEFKTETASIKHLRAKLRVPDAGVSTGTIMEEIGAELAIQKKITSFKPLEEKMVNGYIEKGVQVDIEGITLNQAVNFLYRIKTHKSLLLIRDFSMKARFANPGLLDITIQVVLVTRRAPKG